MNSRHVGERLTPEQFAWLKSHMRRGEWRKFKRDYGLSDHRDDRRSDAARAERGLPPRSTSGFFSVGNAAETRLQSSEVHDHREWRIPVYLTPTMYAATEAAGYDMDGFVKIELLPLGDESALFIDD